MGEQKKDVKSPTLEESVTREATRQVFEVLSVEMDGYESSKRKKVCEECCDIDEYRLGENEEVILSLEKIRKKIRKHYKYISELIGPEIEKYHENEVSDFLKWYFFRDYEIPGTADIFYRRTSKSGDFKRLHAHMKDGKFEYNYEDFITAFMGIDIPREEKQKLNDIHMALEWHTANLHKGLEDWVDASKKNVSEYILRGIQYKLKEVWGLLMNVFQVAKDDITELEDISEHQTYTGVLGMGYVDILSCGVVNIFRTIAFELWERQGINNLLEQIKSYMERTEKILQEERTHTERYELRQNYAAKLGMKILCRERVIWSDIHAFLLEESESERYSRYKEEYSTEQLEELSPEGFGIYNLKNTEKKDEWKLIQKCFCEGEKSSYLDIKSFSIRLNDCKEVWRWYKEERNINFKEMEWKILKAIYRELYLYSDIPQIIKQVKGQAFINSIKKEMFKSSKVMSELETFYLFKIRRGIAREYNTLERFNSTEVVLCYYYKYEKVLFEKNWDGKYLSELAAYICGRATSYEK